MDWGYSQKRVVTGMGMIEGKGMKIQGKERKTRSDKKVKICPYLSQELFAKLNRLARSCDISETQLLILMAETFLNHPQYINWVQDKYGVSKDDPFRVIPQVTNGKVSF